MRISAFLKRKKLNWKDLFLLILCAVLVTAVWKWDMLEVFPISITSSVDQGYSAPMAEDGTLYILDSGHERLVHTDQEGNILGEILSSRFGSGYMYIDGFAFDEEGRIYLHGSEWDGMYLSQEYLYRFDSSGRSAECLFSAEYKETEVNKHRIYGLSAEGGKVRYLLLDQNKITSVTCDADSGKEQKVTIPYPNAFNAVSDAVRSGDFYYILDKDGIIREVNPEAGSELTEVWNLSGSSNAESCIPYRLAAGENGVIYFTDIRNECVCQVTPGNPEAEVVCSDTGTLTVSTGTGAQQDRLLLTESDEVRIVQDGETAVSVKTLYRPKSEIFGIALFAGVDLLALLALILVAMRLFGWISARGISSFVRMEILVVSLLLLVSSVVIFILMQEFSDRYQDQLCSQVESAAYMVATQVDASDIENVNTAEDFDGESYARLCRVMKNSYTKNVDFYKDLYCNILRCDENGQGYAVAYLDQSIGSYFPLDEYESEEVCKVYETGKPVWNKGKADISGSYLYVKVPVLDENGSVCGVVAAGMDTSVMSSMMNEMIREVLVALIIVILLILLALREIAGYIGAKNRYEEEVKRRRTAVLPGHSVRILVFSVFTAYNIASTFLPVYLMRQSKSVDLISHELAASLPITVNIFAIGVMSLFCARLVSRIGIRRMAAVSGLLSLCGNLLIFLLPYYPAIFAGLLLDGLGVGLISNVLYIMITYVKDPENRREGFTIYNGACLSGINFGMMLGAVLAVNFGEQNVYGFIVLIWAVVIFLTVKVSHQVEYLIDDSAEETEARVIAEGTDGAEAASVHAGGVHSEECAEKNSVMSADGQNLVPEKQSGRSGRKKEGGFGIKDFLRSRGVMSFFVLIQNPYIIFSSFIFYYVPLFCADNGYGETITSLLLMLYALLSVYMGEWITEQVSDRFGNRSMYLAYALNIVAVLIFAWHPEIRTMILALILLGFSASFGKAIQQEYYMEMEPVERYGKDQAMGVYNFTENIGESLGPIVFGRLMFMKPLSLAVSGFSGLIAALGAIHFIGSRKKEGKQNPVSEGQEQGE